MTHLDELLSVYLDGEATPAESVRIASHLGECLHCRRRLDELSRARAAVRSLPTLEMPVGLAPQPADEPGRRRRYVWMGAAAAVTAATIAVAAAVTTPPDPINLSEVSRQIGARASLDAGAAPLKVVMPEVVHE